MKNRRFLTASAAMVGIWLLGAGIASSQLALAQIGGSSAVVRRDNALIVDIEVNAGASVSRLQVTYDTPGVDPLVSRWVTAAPTGPSTITIGRLRASKTYRYSVRGIDSAGAPAGAASGTFTTGALPAALAANT